MNISAIIAATILVAAVGLFIGVFLGVAGKKFAVDIDERLEKMEWDKEQKLLENKSQEIKNMEKTIGRE